MNKWLLLFRKEMSEYARNFKWLWIPLVFLLLGIMNPITSYYMPQILEASGIDADAAKLIQIPYSIDIMAKSLSQYGTMGLLVLALSFMGAVAGERQSGTAVLVFVKPVSHLQYLLAKWAVMAAITLTAVLIGQVGTWYYTNLLFDPVALGPVLLSALVYTVWLLLIGTLVLLLGCLLKSQAGIAFVALIVAAVLSILASLPGHLMDWSPGKLGSSAAALLRDGSEGYPLALPLSVSIILIAALLLVSVYASKKTWSRG